MKNKTYIKPLTYVVKLNLYSNVLEEDNNIKFGSTHGKVGQMKEDNSFSSGSSSSAKASSFYGETGEMEEVNFNF